MGMSSHRVNTIKILNVNFGCADSVTCSSGIPNSFTQNTNCYAPNTLSTVSSLCNGLKSCTVEASSTVFTDPCNTTATYLTVSYTCTAGHLVFFFFFFFFLTSFQKYWKEKGSTFSISLSSASMISPHVSFAGAGDVHCGSSDMDSGSIVGRKQTLLQYLVILAEAFIKELCVSNRRLLDFGLLFCLLLLYVLLYLLLLYLVDKQKGSTFSISLSSASMISPHVSFTGAGDGHRGSSDMDSGSIVGSNCNGKRTCTLEASNTTFTDPCAETAKYLTVSYILWE
ncbi:rhamnose-binding lectin-like [Hemibagrus wyckioides]|uniref:rhamnose-binding lectin-like n=1 Tax=Hemibagrus wyckioides TaxID=337641 RepID=UPI00266BD751|nr:rhamnose-binding lectin-like [Hemibagrus wyckioides]